MEESILRLHGSRSNIAIRSAISSTSSHGRRKDFPGVEPTCRAIRTCSEFFQGLKDVVFQGEAKVMEFNLTKRKLREKYFPLKS